MTLLLGVLVASLLGSVHCAAMCGGFTCIYATRGHGPSRSAHAAYNAGRLVSYVLLGTVAGAVGSRVDVVGDSAGAPHLAGALAGLRMIAWAAGVIAAESGVRVPLTLAPEWAKRALGRVLVASSGRSETVRAASLGLATTLLPCGWLYSFVVVAAGTGSAALGAITMVAFWAGTLPMMLVVGAGAARLFGPLARRLPIVSAGVVLTLGVLSVAGKLRPPTTSNSHMHMEHVHVGR